MGKPSEEHDGDDEIEISDDKINLDPDAEGDEEDDRGDVVNPEETEENLKKLADEDEEEDEQPEKASKSIPKPRFDEVNEKRIRAEERARILEEENERLRGGKKTEKANDAPKFDFDAKESEYMDALMEGDKEKASQIRKEIKAAERAEYEDSAVSKAEARIMARQAQQSLAEAAEAVIEDYPFLNSKSAKANKDAIAEVVEWRDFYIQRGKSAADALIAAAKKVGPSYVKAKPKADAEDEDEDEKPPKSKLDELRAARLRKNATAANNQPPRLDGGVGNRGTGGKLNVTDMDDETFNGLSEKEKAKLRGDVA